MLPGRGTGGRSWNRRTVVILFAIANLALVFLFPPFENYGSTLRAGGTYFDGFYFLFGDKWQRHFHVPLLYLEVVWVLINAALPVWKLYPGPIRLGLLNHGQGHSIPDAVFEQMAQWLTVYAGR